MKGGNVNSEAPAFPIVLWDESLATFLPAEAPIPAGASVYAVLVFALQEGRFVVADIPGRGWCIPGGRPEPNETPKQTARREAREEAGAVLGPLRALGHFVLTDPTTQTQQIVPAFVAEVLRLEPLPPDTEAFGVRLLSLEELPRHYYLWDALTAAVFAYANGSLFSPG
ncbi:MAG TPA: NUDIX hydrolase [Chthonomonadaceae bacterium]|nr:NUDIX hydrolase [Chthonomonadaceae bacterium]